MSHEAFAWALRQDVPPGERFVLAVLADRSNHDGVCWPSLANVARLTGHSLRTVRRLMASLQDRGLVESQPRVAANGRTTTNVYLLRLDHGVRLADVFSEGVAALSDAVQSVDNPVDNKPELSTGVTPCQGGGVMVSPSEGVMVSPLDPPLCPRPVEHQESSSTAGAVDNECRALPGAATDSPSAPSGAPVGSACEQLDAAKTDGRADARFLTLDARFDERFGKLWRKRSARQEELWRHQLGTLSEPYFQIGLARAIAPRASAPPGPYGFMTLALTAPDSPTRADPPANPCAARDARRYLEHLQRREPAPSAHPAKPCNQPARKR